VPERTGELLDLAPGDLCQADSLLDSQPQLGADAGRVGEESIP
jgi:hypothetical protein